MRNPPRYDMFERKRSEPLRVAPDLFAPVLDEVGVVFELCLEVGEAAAEDEDLVWDVEAVALELVACFRV